MKTKAHLPQTPSIKTLFFFMSFCLCILWSASFVPMAVADDSTTLNKAVSTYPATLFQGKTQE